MSFIDSRWGGLPSDTRGTRRISKSADKDLEKPFAGHPSLRDRRARSIRIVKGLEGTEKPMTSTDAAQDAVKVLFALLKPSRPKHVQGVLEETTAFLDEQAGGKYWTRPPWCAWLAGQIMEATPPQHRYIVVQYFVKELQAHQDTSSKQQALICILQTLFAAPRTAIFSFPTGDMLRAMAELIAKHPADPEYPRAITTLLSQVFHPTQLSEAIAELLDVAVNVQRREMDAGGATAALVGCAKQLVELASQPHTDRAESKQELTTDGLARSLHLLSNEHVTTRLNYLELLTSITRSVINKQDGKAQTDAAEISPSITLSSSVRAGVPLRESSTAMFFKQLQVRLGMCLEGRVPSPEGTNAIEGLLKALYSTKDGQVVLDGVPVMLAWRSAAGDSVEKQAAVAQLLSAASKTLAEVWNVPLIPDAAAFMQSLASSATLQSATLLSEAEITTRLSQPYFASPLSPSSGLETLASPTRSIRTSRYGNNNGAPSVNMSLKGARASEASITVADLKAALSSQSPGRKSLAGTAASSVRGWKDGKASPDRSSERAGSTSSSVHGRGSVIAGPPHGASARISPTHSTRSGRGTPQKPRLDRIPGSMDESRNGDVFAAPAAYSPKVPNPPYQL